MATVWGWLDMNVMKAYLKAKMNDMAFIGQFAVDDFKAKYAGSALGILWAFLQPVITIVLYWFVFQLGFRSQPIDGFPFVLWLMAGLVPWFFLSEAVANATTCLSDYSYLVKKVLFHIDILPLAKIAAVMFVQLALVLFVFLCYMLGGYMPYPGYVRLLVYLAYMAVIAAGISYMTSALYVFFKDVLQVVSIVTQIVFWITPIAWPFGNMPEAVRKVLVYNPAYYAIEGFRSVLVYREQDGNDPWMTLYYWTAAFLLLGAGLWLFRRCRSHFADML